jgi:hypothetical protein
MMQEMIVFLIVACAAWMVAVRYMPAALRRIAWERISALARRQGWMRLARHADMRLQGTASCSTGCKQCDGCGTAAQPGSPEQPVIIPEQMKKRLAK